MTEIIKLEIKVTANTDKLTIIKLRFFTKLPPKNI